MTDFKVGDKIQLILMKDDPFPIEKGTIGIITNIVKNREEIIIEVDWENGRNLNLIYGIDEFKKI